MIQKLFEEEFARARMMCIIENIFEDGEWTIFRNYDLVEVTLLPIGK